MKVGDYVRTPYGIRKVKEIRIKDTYLDDGFYVEDRYIICGHKAMQEVKSSPNIIDLIEVGDYVNGKLVIKVATDYIFDYSEEIKIIYFSENDYIYRNQDIKSIVTREQFSNIEYKVGENE